VTSSWEYNNGIMLFGVLKMYEKTGNANYINYIDSWADPLVNDTTGAITFPGSAHNIDYYQPCSLLIDLYNITGDIQYKRAADYTWNTKFPSIPKNPAGGFWHKDTTAYKDVMMLDSIYMAEPFAARYGATYSVPAALDTATFQTLLLSSHAWNSTDKLLYHAWEGGNTYTYAWEDLATGLSSQYWSRGTGWYFMALVDMLDYLPAGSARDNILSLFQSLAEGIKNCQSSTNGLWYQVLDKGSLSDNWIETSGSGMFIYAFKKGYTKGYLDSSYLTAAQNGWTGLKTYISGTSTNPVFSGTVVGMSVQASYSAYVSQNHSGTNLSQGLCAVMLAASVMEY
jgi:unsaturated rhamnogalacturonyl hydrolase